MRQRTAALVTATALAGGLLAACSGGGQAAPPPPAGTGQTTTTVAPTTASPPPTGGPAADWPTYHRDNGRTGVADVAPVGTLRRAWLANLDGAVYGQPLVVSGLVLAATENDTVYALDQATGRVRWRAHVGSPQPGSGLPCGNIDPLGVTGTMAYDQPTGRVFAVAETAGGAHTLVGIDVRTGSVAVRAPVEPPKGDRIAHQQRSALTVLNGRVYVAYGGLFGDCANYIGSVVSVTTAGADKLSYAIPTTREAGIWAPGGAVVSDGQLLYSAGNGESTRGYDGSDSVIALSPALRRVDLFAPATWPQDNASDLDLGSSSPVRVGPWVFAAGKRGTGYAMRAGHLGGVGGEAGQADICRSFGGASVSGAVAYIPCTDGTRAVVIGSNGTPAVRWRASVQAAGSPVVGGGAVWVTDYDAGVLYALNTATGRVRARLSVGDLPHFASPTLSGSTAYVGTLHGVVAVAGA
ncbi:MAG TPA: PQQ-binding-like beta-propeller repeat protein [Pseudonocardiaceae bacterium]|nr:PQQ-binding-like beta-propeller repeat protein [Pseudonocardiaceae bacterium]